MKKSPASRLLLPSISGMALVACLVCQPNARAASATLPFAENFESILDTNYWTLTTPWGPTLETARAGSSSLADSPSTFLNPLGTYANNADASATLAVDLRFATRPMLTFWQHYVFESGQDYGFVEVSKNLGASWTRWAAFSDAGTPGWTQVRLDLTEYAGAQTLVRWRVKTDAAYQYDGWYVDDVAVAENPAGVRLSFADAMDTVPSATNWMACAWTQVPGSATNAGTGMSWRCRFGNNYRPGGSAYCPLTLVSKLNLGTAVNPKLSFWYRAGSQANNTLYAQASTDGGRNWSTLWSWSSYWWNAAGWNRTQVDLNSLVGQTNLTFRFLAYQNPDNEFNLDFQVDDVLIDEAPADVALSVGPGTDARHNALLTWTQSPATDFAYYAIYRSTSAGVDPTDTLIATISTKATTSFQDTNLPVVNQFYYYRVLVYDTQGLHNWGTNDVLYRTAWGNLAGFPFTETFEGTDAYWACDWPWAITTEPSHGGTHCLTDSPGREYANNVDLSAYLRINLGTASRPMLSFWQRYACQPNQDYGFVEVSSDNGTNWTRWYGVTSQSGSNWTKLEVDLAAYAGTISIVRFRLRTDASSPYDGWYLDDVELKDYGSRKFVGGFADSADTVASATNWVSSAWQQVAGSATNVGGMSWRAQMGNNYRPGGSLYSALTLAGSLNLGAAVNPKLWFQWRAGNQANNTLYAQASTDSGRNWTTLWSWNSYWWVSPQPWSRREVSLASYVGNTNVTLRFLAYQNPDNEFNFDFQVDDIIVGEQPAPAPEVAASVAPGTDPRHAALLSWSSSTAPAFAWYGIYRSTSPNVTVASQLVTAISNRVTVSYQDTGLDVCGQTYYYRVIVWDTNGLSNLGLSDLAYKTAWGQTVSTLPFSDSLEGGDGSWALDRPWAIATETARTGTRSLSDSPGGNYANNADVSAYLNVSLASAARPMLSFWQRYAFELDRDFGFVEVSADNGANWTRVYGITGQGGTNWTRVQIDLGNYAGSVALIRFRIRSDSANPFDGWYIDDVTIGDFGLTSKGYPFYDPMDTSASPSNWVASAWSQVGGSANGGAGQSWQCDIGNNYRPGGSLYSSLTLAGRLNLAAAVNPKLSFWFRAASQANNTLYVQTSLDGGRTWGNFWSWSSYWWNASGWTRPQLDLNAYIGQTNLALRFLCYQNADNEFNLDFQVDQVLVDEAPTDLGVNIAAGPDPRHSATLTWGTSPATDFAYYAIYRSTSPGVGLASTLITTITNKATATFTDTNLAAINQTYYYRVLVYDTQGLHNWGTNDVSYHTAWGALASFPFTETFESGLNYWAADFPWGLTTESAHSGAYSLTDSPGNSYADNADASAYLRVSLAGATRPMLTFWQRYGLQLNQDYGFVEVSNDAGANWTRLYGLTSQSGYDWQFVRVDLGAYAGTQVVIRFRLRTDGSSPYDGWYLDDVQLREAGSVAMGYPFFDGMDTTASQSNWIASAWQQIPGSATTGSGMSWRAQMGNNYRPGGNLYNTLALAGGVNLAGASSPQLWFWWRAGSQANNTLYLQASTDGGHNWNNLWSWNSYWWQNSTAWSRVQVSLAGYLGYTNVVFRYLAYQNPDNEFNFDFQVDDFLVSEGGGCPAILTSSPLPTATRGYPYNVFLQATNGSPPYVWSVVSNSLPSGLALDPLTGSISGSPTNAGTYNFWLGVNASNVCSAKKQFSLTVEEYLPLYASHSAGTFVSPGTNIVYCQVDNQTGRRLLGLVWVPTLPGGWSIVNVTGDGSPELGGDGRILFQAANLSNAPLRFNYSVRVPAGETQARQISGAAVVLLENIAGERTVPATPNPLFTTPRNFHSADCNTNWVIETTEANRVLAYWRAQAYQLDANSCDGYAPGAGGIFGPLHSADYRSSWWVIDGTEVNRVLAYWRAGCYKRDAAGLDGYSTCTNAGGRPAKDPPSITQQAPPIYTAGGSFMITNKLQYSGHLLALLWRPQLPAGWTISSIIADGTPEYLGGDILWTGSTIPPTPITALYVVQVPPGEQGAKQLHAAVEYQYAGAVNPTTAYAAPDPLNITSPYVVFTGIQRQTASRVQLNLLGTMTTPVRIQAAPDLTGSSWTTLTNLPNLNGALQFTDLSATNTLQRYYRTVAP
jgi:hypothetical protein